MEAGSLWDKSTAGRLLSGGGLPLQQGSMNCSYPTKVETVVSPNSAHRPVAVATLEQVHRFLKKDLNPEIAKIDNTASISSSLISTTSSPDSEAENNGDKRSETSYDELNRPLPHQSSNPDLLPHSPSLIPTPGESIAKETRRANRFRGIIGYSFGAFNDLEPIDTALLLRNLRALEMNTPGVSEPLNPESSQSTREDGSSVLSEFCAFSEGLNTAAKSPDSVLIETQLPIAFSKLNRCDWSEVMANKAQLTWTQQTQLAFVEPKPGLHADRYPDDTYLAQSALLILSSLGSADRYSRCGIPNAMNKSGLCRIHKFCPACSSQIKFSKWLTYAPAFESGTWFFITGSWKGDLPFDTGSAAQDSFRWVEHWDAYRKAFASLWASKDINGFYLVDELAINSMLPVRALPHVHAIVEAGWFEDEQIEKLSAAVETGIASAHEENLKPDIKVSPILSAGSLMSVLRYMHKPLSMTTAYASAWARHCSDTRDRATELNSQATDIVMGFAEVTKGRNKMSAKGTLNPKDKSFIGISKPDVQKYRGMISRLQSNDAGREVVEW